MSEAETFSRNGTIGFAEGIQVSEPRAERNYGIDALRIYSMFLVVILHILGHGGVLENAVGANKHIAWFIEVAAYCAVDIYALISGYVGYTDQPKPFGTAKFLTMWLQVFCYSFGITACAFLIRPEAIGLKDLIRSAFPVASNKYWFFSCYVALFFLMPWLNRFIRSLDDAHLTKLVAVLACVFSIYMVSFGKIGRADPFALKNGYSTIWLIVLYIIGAWIKRTDLKDRIQAKYAWITILFCVLLAWFFRDILQIGIFVNYTSPTILLIAMAYLVIFAKMRPKKVTKKIVSFFAPAAFGVYLIHDNELVRSLFISRFFGWITAIPSWMMVFAVIGCALGIMICCMAIEKIRLVLFKVLKIDSLLLTVGERADIALNKVSDKISASSFGR